MYWAQRKLNCCGTNGSSSYDNRTSGIPESCCPVSRKTDSHHYDPTSVKIQNCTAENAFKEGCSKKFESIFVTLLFVLGAVFLSLCIIDILVLLSVHHYLEHINSIARAKMHIGVSKAIKTLVAVVPLHFVTDENIESTLDVQSAAVVKVRSVYYSYV